jgi:hypothetical protein
VKEGQTKDIHQTGVVRPVRQVSALLGFLHKMEVDAIFKQQPFETKDGSDPLELWREYSAKVSALPPYQAKAIKELPVSLHAEIEEIKTRSTYKKHYEPLGDCSFVLAPIESLMSPQWYADIDYVNELSSQINKTMTITEQLQLAVSEGRITEPIIRGNQVVFSSPRLDLHADQIPAVRKTESGEFEIFVRAARRPNYIQVVRLGDRLLLTNGVHKVCAFYQQGFTEVPCLYRTVQGLEEAGVDPNSTTLYSPPVFQGQRPCLVKDFLDANLAVPLHMRPMYQVLQVTIGVGAMQVPALPQPQPQALFPEN